MNRQGNRFGSPADRQRPDELESAIKRERTMVLAAAWATVLPKPCRIPPRENRLDQGLKGGSSHLRQSSHRAGGQHFCSGGVLAMRPPSRS